MRTSYKALFAVGLLAGGIAFAQGQLDKPKDAPPKNGPPHGHRPPPPPLVMIALDANHDGILDAEEIANASAALLKLDKNGDGKLTREELCPHCPEFGPGPDDDDPDGPPPFDGPRNP